METRLDARGGSPADDAPTASQPYVRQWNQLISTTNWEKGRIISQWRAALLDAEATVSVYSDEAWSVQVGGVSPQHVGRLRRVYQRFGEVYSDYPGLFWSHFQAAVDWDDAEMWLEGAVQNGWSVSQLRQTRWKTLGAVADERPRDDEIVTSELDEDFDETDVRVTRDDDVANWPPEGEGPPIPEGPDFGDEDTAGPPPSDGSPALGNTGGPGADTGEPTPAREVVQPFTNLAELPADMSDAFESFKLAILRHKAENWSHISRDDVLATLDSLKELVLAPQ